MTSFSLVLPLKYTNSEDTYYILINRHNLIIIANFFSYRIISAWNQLPSDMSCQNNLCCSRRYWTIIILPTLPFLNCEFLSFFKITIILCKFFAVMCFKDYSIITMCYIFFLSISANKGAWKKHLLLTNILANSICLL